MKTPAVPDVCVSPELPSIQKAFIERGLASAKAARKSGKYVPAAKVLDKLARRLEKAR